MFTKRSKRFWITLVVCVTAFVFYFPSLVAFRYTAPSQNVGFLYRPWKSWAFAYAALTVPGDARLKTSGEALRAAEAVWPGPSPAVHEVRVLFVDAGRPYEFVHEVAGRPVTTTVVPPYDFVWQVRGAMTRNAGDTIVGLIDYRSGEVLYDVRSDLGGAQPIVPYTPPTASPSPPVSPSAPTSYGP